METIYTVIVVILLVLAILGLVVGVSNDAVNFLNSAIGSKAASRKVIFTIASVGILLGTMTSSGMREVARSGVFYPEMFTFRDVMMLCSTPSDCPPPRPSPSFSDCSAPRWRSPRSR